MSTDVLSKLSFYSSSFVTFPGFTSLHMFPKNHSPWRQELQGSHQVIPNLCLVCMAIRDIKFTYNIARAVWMEKDIYKTSAPAKAAEDI